VACRPLPKGDVPPGRHYSAISKISSGLESRIFRFSEAGIRTLGVSGYVTATFWQLLRCSIPDSGR